jgi:hypothetical protein
MLNRPADLTGNKRPTNSLIAERAFFPHCSCIIRRVLVWQGTRVVHKCAAVEQYCSTFVSLRRGFGYAQELTVVYTTGIQSS